MTFDWLTGQDLERLPQFLTALAIGLLIGLERERNPSAKAGLRTFALVALAGSSAAVLAEAFDAPSILAVGLGTITLMMIGAYYPQAADDQDPGTTTVAAVAACYLLAALAATDYARLAVMLAILATILLYFKAELGGAARRLERRDLVSILQFAVVAFVVLPLLPDRGLGPYEVLNPRHVWLMVVLISGLSLAGYVAMKVVGIEHGGVLLGVFGGLVSSTATTLAYSRYAREGNAYLGTARTVVLVANLVVPVRLAVLAAMIAPGVLVALGPVLGASLLAGLTAYALGHVRSTGEPTLAMPALANPAELRAALGFASLYAIVLMFTSWLGDVWGSRGVYVAAILAGLTDVDAITLSNLRLHHLSQLSAREVAVSVTVALCANIAFKLGVAGFVGGAPLLRRCAPTMAAAAAGAGVALFALP